jgi:RNA polymerase sigma-70 factor (ECF subfamily)
VNPERDDVELVTGVQAGDTAAFGELVRRYQPVAFRTAYLVVRDPAAAEDVIQEGFVRAYRGIGSFRAGDPFRPWVLRIVTNLALNEVRGRGRRAGLLERVGVLQRRELESVPAPEAVALATERQRQLWRAISELPLDDRVVLYLRYFLDLPEREIAVVIGKAPGTVKSRLHRSGERLRRVIETRYPGLRPAESGGGGSG